MSRHTCDIESEECQARRIARLLLEKAGPQRLPGIELVLPQDVHWLGPAPGAPGGHRTADRCRANAISSGCVPHLRTSGSARCRASNEKSRRRIAAKSWIQTARRLSRSGRERSPVGGRRGAVASSRSGFGPTSMAGPRSPSRAIDGALMKSGQSLPRSAQNSPGDPWLLVLEGAPGSQGQKVPEQASRFSRATRPGDQDQPAQRTGSRSVSRGRSGAPPSSSVGPFRLPPRRLVEAPQADGGSGRRSVN